MITVYPFEKLGIADFGWLKARYHFSFARYRNPDRMGFGALRVINDDRVSAGKGFDEHPHDNMEIITYVRSGGISHKDSMGNEGRTGAGDVQVMSAGTGVRHAEYNKESEDTTLYQIWIEPNAQNVEPRWETRAFPRTPVNDALPVLASGRAEHKEQGALFIHQDAAIFGGRLEKGTQVTQPIKHQAYILASAGRFTVNGEELNKGDGAEITGTDSVTITADDDAEILIIDVPAAA